MRSKLQKEMDEKNGLKDVEYSFNLVTGKIEEKGKMHREFDPEFLIKGMPGLEQHILDLGSQISDIRKRLEEVKDAKENAKVHELMETLKLIQKIEAKKKLDEQLEKLEKERQFHYDTLSEQKKLLEEYKAWAETPNENPSA